MPAQAGLEAAENELTERLGGRELLHEEERFYFPSQPVREDSLLDTEDSLQDKEDNFVKAKDAEDASGGQEAQALFDRQAAVQNPPLICWNTQKIKFLVIFSLQKFPMAGTSRKPVPQGGRSGEGGKGKRMGKFNQPCSKILIVKLPHCYSKVLNKVLYSILYL